METSYEKEVHGMQVTRIILLMLVLIPSSMAIGISPGKRTIESALSSNLSLRYTLYNNDGQEFEGTLSVEGMLAQYASSPVNVRFSRDQELQDAYIAFLLPDDMEPGQVSGWVVFSKQNQQGNATIGTSVTEKVKSSLVMDVPYPERYLIAELIAHDVPAGETLPASLEIANLGSNYTNASITIGLQDLMNMTIAESSADLLIMPGKKEDNSIEFVTKGLAPGSYRITARVSYADHDIHMSQDVELDEFLLDVHSIDTKLSGNIAKITANVQNIGNRKIDAHASTRFGTQQVQSIMQDIEPGKDSDLEMYIELGDAPYGTYNMTVFIHYDDKTTERKISVKYDQPNMSFFLTGGIALVLLLSAIYLWKRPK